MKRSKNSRTIALACGASLFWTSRVLQYTVWTFEPLLVGPQAGLLVSFAPTLLLAVLFFLSKYFYFRRAQTTLALCGCLLLVACLAVYSIPLALPFPRESVAYALMNLGDACVLAFWGLSFASLNKENAEYSVLLGIVLTFALSFLLSWIPFGDLSAHVCLLLKILSIVPFLLNAYDIPTKTRTPNANTFGLMIPFYLSRIFLGACMGLIFSILPLLGRYEFAPSVLPSVALFLIMVLAAAYLIKTKRTSRSILAISPLLIIGFLAVPYIGSDDVMLLFAAIGKTAVYLSWIILTSVQLSYLKERVGMDEAFLSFSEKLTFLAGAALTSYLINTFSAFQNASQQEVFWVVAVVIYCALSLLCFLIIRVVEEKDKESFYEQGMESSRLELSKVYRGIAEEFSLTRREQEVVRYLAAGYTQIEIGKRLYISQNTVKAHIGHIYKKTGTHSRQDLINLTESEKQKTMTAASSSDVP